MGFTPVTVQQLIDASQDSETLAAVINGGVGVSVVTRTGLSIESLATAIAGIHGEGTSSVNENVAYTAAPNFSLTSGNNKTVTLGGDISGFTVSGIFDGAQLTVCWKQGSGGHAVAWPSNFINATPINTASDNNGAGTQARQTWRYDAASNNWYAMNPLMFN